MGAAIEATVHIGQLRRYSGDVPIADQCEMRRSLLIRGLLL